MTTELSVPQVTGRGAAGSHPLDPLSAAEITAVRDLLVTAGEVGEQTRFVMTTLAEPAKPEGLVFDPAAPPDRVAKAILYDRATSTLKEAYVDLTLDAVAGVEVVEGKFPSYIMEEMFSVEEIVRADVRWQDAMRARGVEDFSLVMIDPWPSGYTGTDDDPRTGRRYCRPLTFVRSAPGEHGYARPVEGLICTVDLDAMTVVEVADHGVVPLPRHPGNYDPERMLDPMNRPAFDGLRTDLKPISITQPEGPSFTVDGWSVAWQKWNLRVGFTPREGLVLHQITYDDKGRTRPVVYRASLSEMVVPYGDMAPTHWNKNVFDEGEVGMGFSANSLTLGCDCLGHIHYFDAVVNNSDGAPLEIPNAICMHEEDYGIAWKHTDFRTGEVEVRRSRRLVISSIATVGNYEYGFFWYLYTDATIEFEVKLTGVLTTGAIEPGTQPRHGVVVAPGLYGPNHQHFFNVRLDMTVDGVRNSVYEIDSVPDEPGGEFNPRHNTWVARPTLLETEKAGARNVSWETARYWKIANRGVVNELGQEVAWKLMPGLTAPPMFQPGSAIYDRARFCQHEVWVTKYDPSELYAAGNYPYQSPEVEGLPKYVEDDASIVDEDLVVWYTVGAHHIVRPEDWPVMPVTYASFHLKPVGFFDGNPALDLPRSEPMGHGDDACHC
ncbi:MAG: primary-amine oxidase [Actinobacteria bacterium]|nr:primary-amine oxidase [Actinomycetota bacterium]